jgi:hypothetical protein
MELADLRALMGDVADEHGAGEQIGGQHPAWPGCRSPRLRSWCPGVRLLRGGRAEWLTALDEREHGRYQRTHPGGEHQTGFGALQRRDRIGQFDVIWISVTRVEIRCGALGRDPESSAALCSANVVD